MLVVLVGLLEGGSAFLLPSPTRSSSMPLQATGGSKTKEPLTWQESLELLISPTTTLAQRQVLFQVHKYLRVACARSVLGCSSGSNAMHSSSHSPPTQPTPPQDVVSRAPEIRKDVEEAIREGSVDGLLTDGVKAVVRF